MPACFFSVRIIFLVRTEKSGSHIVCISAHCFILWHYQFGSKYDTPFWTYAETLKPEPIFRAVKNILGSGRPKKTKVILLSPQGKKLSQNLVWQLSHSHHLIFICGRYEGVDERVANNLATDEISIGDYILSGGELATCVLIDCLVRITPGVLNNYKSAINESFSYSRAALKGSTKNLNYSLLDHPQYTRPEIFDGMKVPSVLLSGNHKKIKRWRRKKALEKK